MLLQQLVPASNCFGEDNVCNAQLLPLHTGAESASKAGQSGTWGLRLPSEKRWPMVLSGKDMNAVARSLYLPDRVHTL